MNKPPVLSDGRICIIAACSYYREGSRKYISDELVPIEETNNHYLMKCKEIAQAQRDADVEWYEKNQEPHFITTPEIIIKTRQEVAREIFEEIEKEHAYDGDDGPGIDCILSWDWQALKSRFLNPTNPVGNAEL